MRFGVNILVSKFYVKGADDPCLTASTLPGEIWRSVAYNTPSESQGICDVTIIEKWYRIDSEAGNDTISFCPPIRRCGTVHPIWMNGKMVDKRNENIM